jgi:hypothetical protein
MQTYMIVEERPQPVVAVPLGLVVALHDLLVDLTPEEREAAIKAALLFAST